MDLSRIAILTLLILESVLSQRLSETTTSYGLDQQSNVIYACDYSAPTHSIEYQPSGLPCSSIYVNSSVLNNFLTTFTADQIESIWTLSVNSAKRCFKLKLTTSCKQKWLSDNEISKTFQKLDTTRDECLGSNTCNNCEVSGQYLSPYCESFNFGTTNVDTTKVFTSNEIIYQNVLGETMYNKLSTYDDVMYLGGDYGEKMYFEKLPLVEPKKANFTINPITKELLSLDLKKIMVYENRTINHLDRVWYVYDGSHLVDKKAIDDAIQKVLDKQSSSMK